MSTADDPRRSFKIGRLHEALGAIPKLVAREPLLHDPDFDTWRHGVMQHLTELFDVNRFGYLQRFVKIHFHSTIRPRGARQTVFQTDYRHVWESGLQQADALLREAITEAELGPAVSRVPRPTVARAEHPIVINVSNIVQNAFSPSVHVTIAQLLDGLNSANISEPERRVAADQLRELDAELKGEQRWPNIARSLEAMKSLGKSMYKDFAVPLLVEYLKQQSGLGPRG